MHEFELSQSLHDKHFDRQRGVKDVFFEKEGIRYTHPYQLYDGGGYYLDEETKNCLETANQLLHPDTIELELFGFLKKVHGLQENRGTVMPIDLLRGIFIFSQQNPRFQELGIPPIEVLEDVGLDIQDFEKTRSIVSSVISDPKLSSELADALSILVPQESPYLERYGVSRMFDALGIQSGVLLDVGCGTGEKTERWTQDNNLFAIGMDRQYQKDHFAPYWEAQKNQSGFVRADFASSIPLRSETVVVAVMEAVVPYQTKEATVITLNEIARVLKPQGIFLVGPQTVQNFNNMTEWRVFRKEKQDDGNYVLIEHSLRELIQKSS